ncbi:MAG TPA: glucose-6-phosphate isomerase [Candidatus Eisenbacteria bacterium]|nr:glucose-6-phosphate isomerase [Candidatus Eisenbacteria bacterium]
MKPIRQTETPGSVERAYAAALEELSASGAIRRLAKQDPTLWGTRGDRVAVAKNRLGWVDAPSWLEPRIGELRSFATRVRDEGFTRVLLLGMGGSSLAPEVLQSVCTPGPGAPTLDVLDSTDPVAIQNIEEASRLDRTCFLVSSKSGGTIETMSQLAYFRARLEDSGVEEPGSRFAAVTDPGSPLDALAKAAGFRAVFRNPADVGGRYSALTYFGMVPAALLGLDLPGLHARAAEARRESLAERPEENGALRLAALLAAAAREGRDKLTIVTSSALRPLGYWIEQLVAESTGKDGVGIIPVEGEPLGPAHHYGPDRILLSISVDGEPDPDGDRLLTEWTRGGNPAVRIELPDRDSVAGEFYRWEVATALAGALLDIDPFDEPNVQESKDATREILAELERTRALPGEHFRTHADGVEIHAPDELWSRLTSGVPSMPSLELVLNRFLALAGPGDYLAILAYLERTAATEASFALLRRAIRNAIHLPVLQGYGPRYLHSIGQLYKGGPPRGLFLEITTADPSDLPIPGKAFTFGQLKTAQAVGDVRSLERHGRPALRLHLARGLETGLASVTQAAERAVSALSAI